MARRTELRPYLNRSGDAFTRRQQALGGPSQRSIGTLEQYGPLGADNQRRQLGRSAVLTADLSDERARRRATLIYAAASRAEKQGPSLGESLAQEMCITLSKRLLGTVEPNSKARVLATLRWGGGGHQCSAEFDALEGTTVRPVGSYCQLDVELVNELDGSAPTADVEVGAFVGYGRSMRPATLSDYGVTTELAASLEFFVPPFATAFTWWANANLGIEWLDGTTVLYAGLGGAAQPLATRGQLLPVPPATSLRITPSAPGAAIITWHLAI